MMVYINNDRKGTSRNLVNAELVKKKGSTLLVKLPDGNVVLRKKSRDLPNEKGNNEEGSSKQDS